MAWKEMRGRAVRERTDLGRRDRWLLLLGDPFVVEAPNPRWFLFTTLDDSFRTRDHVHGVERAQDAEYGARDVFALALDRIRCAQGARIETSAGVRTLDLKIPYDDPRWVEILAWLNEARNVDTCDL